LEIKVFKNKFYHASFRIANFTLKKNRRAVNFTQSLATDKNLLNLQAHIDADKPIENIYKFVGNFVSEGMSDEQVDFFLIYTTRLILIFFT